MQKIISVFILLFSLTAINSFAQNLASQKVDNPSTQEEIDKNLIIQYAIDNKLENVQSTSSGIYYVLEKQGEGASVTDLTLPVLAHYHGTTLDGQVFDSSVERGEAFRFSLKRVIPGWQQAIPLLKVGGKGKFIIPSKLAYGSRGAGPKIGPNSVLIFDIELLDIIDEAKEKEKQLAQDQELITKYIAAKEMAMQKTESGIHYMITTAGEGDASPDKNSLITAHYHGTLLDGTIFDSSVERGEPIEFPLGGVIKGWQEAMQLMKKGSKGTFIIPSHLAYGSRAQGKIPSNSVLSFEIELIDFYDKNEKAKMQNEIDDKLIQEFVKANNLSTQKTESGIYYIIETPGEGTSTPDSHCNITAHYHGTLLDGTVFDSSVERGSPIDFPLTGVIKGWQEAIPLLKKGGKGKFIIPSSLAYGSRSAGPVIKPNSILVFDIELVNFVHH